MRTLKLFLLVIPVFLFTGCIEILEEVFLEEDGSGVYTLQLDMKETLESLWFYLPGYQDQQKEFKKSMDDYFTENWSDHEQNLGLKDVKYHSDDYLYTLSFGFDKIETLNKALNKDRIGVTHELPFYKFKDGRVVRSKHALDATPLINSIPDNGIESKEEIAALARMANPHLKYSVLVRYPKKLKYVSRGKKYSTRSADKKAVTFSYSTNAVGQGKENLNSIMRFR